MIGWIARKLGYASAARLDAAIDAVKKLQARIDSAGWDDQTRNHWVNADGLSGDAMVDPATRATLRIRGRHELINSPYGYGSIYTLGNDVIGVGPRLQMDTQNETVNAAVERAFSKWAKAINLGGKLRLAKRTKTCQGEVFLRFFRNPAVNNPVKLDIQLLEGDQIATPDAGLRSENWIDGIEKDQWGNPTYYHVLERHPGDTGRWETNPLQYSRIQASEIFHDFRPDRPGQSRGIPATTSALNLGAQRRSMRQSVLTAAQAIAGLGAVTIESQASANTDAVSDAEAWTTQDVRHGTMTTIPVGYTAKQMKPEQPGTTYSEFDERLIVEQGRPLNMPRAVIMGDSSRYNFASGRLDHQGYDRSNMIEQHETADQLMQWIVQRWALMAIQIKGLLPKRAALYLPTLKDPNWQVECTWVWEEREHVDPLKEATASDKRLKNRTTTYSSEYARQRRDWRDELSQAGRERKALDDAGLLEIAPEVATAAVAVLEKAPLIGAEATAGLLSVMGIPADKAQAMAQGAANAPMPEAAAPAIPPRVAARMPGANGHGSLNGNGVGHAN